MKPKIKPRLPDRTGIVIFPASIFVAAATFAVVLVWDAIEQASGSYQQAHYRSARTELFSQMTAALAELLGLYGSLALALVMIGGLGLWFGRSVMHYRRRTAEDRKAFGLD